MIDRLRNYKHNSVYCILSIVNSVFVYIYTYNDIYRWRVRHVDRSARQPQINNATTPQYIVTDCRIYNIIYYITSVCNLCVYVICIGGTRNADDVVVTNDFGTSIVPAADNRSHNNNNIMYCNILLCVPIHIMHSALAVMKK